MDTESVDLIYLDPPFNSNRNYEAPIGSEAAGRPSRMRGRLSDIDVAWIGLIAEKEPNLSAVIDAAGPAHSKRMTSYLVMMFVRLRETWRAVKPTGSIYLHCDLTASHYLKLLMDCVFGKENFRDEIIWKFSHRAGEARSSGHVAIMILSEIPTQGVLLERNLTSRPRHPPLWPRQPGSRKNTRSKALQGVFRNSVDPQAPPKSQKALIADRRRRFANRKARPRCLAVHRHFSRCSACQNRPISTRTVRRDDDYQISSTGTRSFLP